MSGSYDGSMAPARRNNLRHDAIVANPQWFARRRYGFGVRPTTWQGWLVTVVAIGGAIGALVGLKKTTG